MVSLLFYKINKIVYDINTYFICMYQLNIIVDYSIGSTCFIVFGKIAQDWVKIPIHVLLPNVVTKSKEQLTIIP